MDMTIAICTWNRARLLRQTLDSLGELTIPRDVHVEVVVVDNASTDETTEVVHSQVGKLPVRYLFEPVQGKSHALNRALAQIESDWILWADDDVLVEREWLAAYVESIREYPEADFWGGPIRPVFESDPPAWLTAGWAKIRGAYAAREFGSDPFALTRETLPFGANWAIRTKVQKAFSYDVQLGRQGQDLLAGEETELMLRLLEAGHRGWWVPKAAVRHFITSDRLTEDYLRRFFAGLARSAPQSHSPFALVWNATRAIVHEGLYRVRRPLCRPEAWLHDLAKASTRWGRLGYRRGVPPWLGTSPAIS